MTRPVALLDHGMGNMRSVAKALEAAGADVRLTGDRGAIDSAGALCVPGQGIFGRCIDAIDRLGLTAFVQEWIAADRPFLGICLGMQILYGSSEEGEGSSGLGVLPGKVVRLPPTVTVPHMGWNEVNGEHFYFDHSFAALPSEDSSVTGWCEHGIRFAARVEHRALLAVQFHPEKSGASGVDVLRGWVERT